MEYENETIEVTNEVVSRDEKTELLRKVCDHINEKFSELQLITLFFASSNQDNNPLLSIIQPQNDPFYIDQALLHANIQVSDSGALEATVLTPNREIIHKISVKEFDDDLNEVLNKFNQDLSSCTGFNWNDTRLGTLFQRLRKSDIDSSLIERFNGDIIYRSRACQFVFDNSSSGSSRSSEEGMCFTTQCLQCQNYLIDLDKKYMGGTILKPPTEATDSIEAKKEFLDSDESPAIITQEQTDGFPVEKKKRGRPKGSKNKNYFTVIGETNTTDAEPADLKENDDPEFDLAELKAERVLVNSDDPDFIYGTEEVTLAMTEDDLNEDNSRVIQHQKGLRKRITTKRQRAMLETKRKRGRPPIRVGPIDCTDCGKTFDHVKDYRKHSLEHINSFPCAMGDCVKRFKSQKDLDIHIRKHKGEKPYVCTECDKAYAIRQDLRLHIRTQHTGPRPYKCKICEKAFARPHQLAVHLPVHTGERAHLCSECGNSFSSVSALIDHRKRRHLVIRNHKCQACPKAFFTRQELEAHIRTHTGAKPFQCPTCGKLFSRPHHVKRHIAGVHNREKPRKFIKETSSSTMQAEAETIQPESIIFTTDEMGEAVLIKDVDFETEKTRGGQQQPQFATATSLLQLSQSNTVYQIAGSANGDQGCQDDYILVAHDDDEQKFMPISHLSSFIANAVQAPPPPSSSSTSS